MHKRFAAHICRLALAAGAIGACSSPSTKTSTGTGQSNSSVGSINGTVLGHSLTIADGIQVPEPGSAIPFVFVILGSRTPLCSLLQSTSASAAATNQVANLTSMDISLYDQRSTAVSPGTFPVPLLDASTQGQLQATVLFSAQDGSCSSTVYEFATSGTVTLSSVQSSVAGTFDLYFGSDHVTGDFNVPACDGVALQDSGTEVCEP